MDLHRFSAFDYMKLVVGSALVAAAFQFFTFPNSIVSGGVTGIAQIIRLLTGIPVGVLSILINIPVFYLGWRHRLGTRRLILALCVMALISVLIDALALTGLVVTDEPMLGAVYGGVLNGAGYGLIYTAGTTGGGLRMVRVVLPARRSRDLRELPAQPLARLAGHGRLAPQARRRVHVLAHGADDARAVPAVRADAEKPRRGASDAAV